MPASSSSSSCCFVRAAVVCSSSLLGTYVVLLAAFLIFLHHIIQNSCRLFFAFLSFSALCRYFVPRLRVVSPVQQLSVPLQARNTYAVLAAFLILHQSSELLSAFFLLIFLICLVWLVLLCSTRYASISPALPWLIVVVLFFLCLSLWPHNLYLERMKNQHGHWLLGVLMMLSRKNGLINVKTTHTRTHLRTNGKACPLFFFSFKTSSYMVAFFNIFPHRSLYRLNKKKEKRDQSPMGT